MSNYKLSPQAEVDLFRIWLYGVQRFGQAQADKYYFAFFEQFKKIAQQPYLFVAVNYIREGYRRCHCGVDAIYYRIVNNKVEIMNIIGQQDTKIIN